MVGNVVVVIVVIGCLVDERVHAGRPTRGTGPLPPGGDKSRVTGARCLQEIHVLPSHNNMFVIILPEEASLTFLSSNFENNMD